MKVMFTNLGNAEAAASLKAAKALRAAGISAEVYPDAAKMKKQMSRANELHVPYVAIIGESELAEGKVTLKNMTTGEQTLLAIDRLADAVK